MVRFLEGFCKIELGDLAPLSLTKKIPTQPPPHVCHKNEEDPLVALAVLYP